MRWQLIATKYCGALLHDHSAKEELFRRVTRNVLEHNRDDHLKNFGFLMDAEGRWSLAPFYDFTYSDDPNGWQTLSVAGVGENPTQADLDCLAKDVLGESDNLPPFGSVTSFAIPSSSALTFFEVKMNAARING